MPAVSHQVRIETNRSVCFDWSVTDKQRRPRQPRAEQTRSLIIETAARAFARHGYDGVSLNELITATGMSKGAFYFHFPGKEQVALAAFRAKQRELIDQLTATSDPASSLADQVRRILRRRAQLVTGDPSLRCVIRLGSDLSARSAPDSEYASFQDLAVGLIADLIGRGIRSGEFGPQLEPRAAARAIFAWIVGMDSLSLLASDAKDLPDRTEEVLEMLIPALTARPHRGTARRSRRPRQEGARPPTTPRRGNDDDKD
jgi:AcrR family transcriptional regulator